MFLTKRSAAQDSFDLGFRGRRRRVSPAMRALTRENRLHPANLVFPIFVEEDAEGPTPVDGMPGVLRHPERDLPRIVEQAWADGIRAILLFGVSHHKDAEGSDSWSEKGLMARMIHAAKHAVPDMIVMADCCFCAYTTHGHCGVLVNDHVDNDLTLQNLQKQAVIAAESGADVIAPSAMMDGQVLAIREALDDAGFTDTSIMSYSSKFASAFYGPFRSASGVKLQGDRQTYQLDPANGREALTESLMDVDEGADILMIKPAMPYLDVVAAVKQETLLPMAVYQVSGEYAMIKAAAQAGVLDEEKAMMEAMLSFKRAGADIIITYAAQDLARALRKEDENANA